MAPKTPKRSERPGEPVAFLERRPHMDDRVRLSRRRLLQTLAASGVLAAADLAWWEEPFLTPRRASGATPARFQLSAPEPTRTARVQSLAARSNRSHPDHQTNA